MSVTVLVEAHIVTPLTVESEAVEVALIGARTDDDLPGVHTIGIREWVLDARPRSWSLSIVVEASSGQRHETEARVCRKVAAKLRALYPGVVIEEMGAMITDRGDWYRGACAALEPVGPVETLLARDRSAHDATDWGGK